MKTGKLIKKMASHRDVQPKQIGQPPTPGEQVQVKTDSIKEEVMAEVEEMLVQKEVADAEYFEGEFKILRNEIRSLKASYSALISENAEYKKKLDTLLDTIEKAKEQKPKVFERLFK